MHAWQREENKRGECNTQQQAKNAKEEREREREQGLKGTKGKKQRGESRQVVVATRHDGRDDDDDDLCRFRFFELRPIHDRCLVHLPGSLRRHKYMFYTFSWKHFPGNCVEHVPILT